MIICNNDSNTILAWSLKTESAQEQLKNIQEVIKFLNDKGIYLKIYVMDNECPSIVLDYIINTKKMNLLLVPLYMYRVNATKKAIDSYKNHSISGLATIHPDFLLHL